MTPEDIRQLSVGKSVEIYLAIQDSTHTHKSGVWEIIDGKLTFEF